MIKPCQIQNHSMSGFQNLIKEPKAKFSISPHWVIPSIMIHNLILIKSIMHFITFLWYHFWPLPCGWFYKITVVCLSVCPLSLAFFSGMSRGPSRADLRLIHQFLKHLLWVFKFKKSRKRKTNILCQNKKLPSVTLFSKLNIESEHINTVIL